jgi:hypothetical protein
MVVRMIHPDLDAEIEVHPGAVPHHQRAGWQVASGQDEQGEVWPGELQLFGGQRQVRLRHPDLEGDPITVAESAVPFHREKGWVEVEQEVEVPASLEAKTVPELRELAKDHGISPLPTTKPELLAALAGALATTQQPEEQAGVEPAQPEEEEA